MERIIKNIGSYSILEEIGRGGLAVIYKAKQTNIDRFVIIKELHVHLADDPEFICRFENEAKILGVLHHVNIINIVDYGKDGNSHFIVLEYMDGSDLSWILKQIGALPLNIGLIIASRIISALEYIHEKGIIQRNIKPSHILISKEGKIKLTGFEIAIHRPSPGQTHTGEVNGASTHMTPEQLDGRNIDERSDIYSLGVVLYKIFSGEHPYGRESLHEIITNIIQVSPPESEQLKRNAPSSLRKLILRCLSKDQNKRPSTQETKTYLISQAMIENDRRDFSEVLQEFFKEKGIVLAHRYGPTEEQTCIIRPRLNDKL